MTHKGGTNTTKDVIYIDVDDEITGIIDKVRGSQKKIVALVLPKRATVLQSVVNMKLLKRGAGESKKNLVLITSESGLMPLAGSVGVHVAKSLNSKPEIPDSPSPAPVQTETVEEGELEEEPLDKSRPVGELSGDKLAEDGDETIVLDDEDGTAEIGKDDRSAKKRLTKKFKIPNFNKFRLLLLLGAVGVIVLSMVGYAALAVWPKATITIKTDSTAVSSELVLNLKTGEDVKLDVSKGVLMAEAQEVKKTITQEVPATGEKNNGEKARGTITIINCTAGDSLTIPAGTGVSSAGQTFVTDERITIPVGSNSCTDIPDATSKTVGITAVSAGTKSNVPAGDFTIAGFSGRTKASSSAATSGGTDEIVKVVSQIDVEQANKKIVEQDDGPIRQELADALTERDLMAVAETFNAGEPKTKLSTKVGEPAERLTVTQTVTYRMFGVNKADLEKIIDKNIEDKIDTDKQSVTDYGLADASFSLQGASENSATVAMQTTVVAGAELNAETIKKQIAGKKAGNAKETIKSYPGVTEVEVEYSPFWVSSIPKKTNKITVLIQEPQVVNDDAESSP